MSPKKSNTNWIELDAVDSTNNYAMGLIHAGTAQHGMAVLAHHQTQGKGQRGKVWESEAGANLSFSILVKPQLLPAHGFQLLAAVTVAVCSELQKIIGDETSIKWPNDLYWRDRKTGGILIENMIRGTRWQWAVIGIGININQTGFGKLNNPVSIKQITGKQTDVVQFAQTLQHAVLTELSLLQQNGFTSHYQQYNRLLFCRNQTVCLKNNNRRFLTTVQGVNEEGQLVTGSDPELCFNFGEVEWIF